MSKSRKNKNINEAGDDVMVDEQMCKEYTQSTLKDHAKNKTMWAGSFKAGIKSVCVLDNGKMVKKEIMTSDALFKMFDEVLVNVIDVLVKNADKRPKTTMCKIDFNRDGRIMIANNGMGIPVVKVRDVDNKPIWLPEMVSCRFLAGSNNDDNDERITGGVNGAGLSIVNVNSLHFMLESADPTTNKYYCQEVRNCLDDICEPKISTMKKITNGSVIRKGGVIISFLPNYKKFNFANDDGTLTTEEYSGLRDLFLSRACEASAHTKLKIVFNGKTVEINSLEKLACAYLDECVVATIKPKKIDGDRKKAKTKQKKKVKTLYPWDIALGVSQEGKFRCVSLVNGVSVKGGVHIKHLKNQIVDGLKKNAEKLIKKFGKFNSSMITNNLFILMSGKIAGPEFNSQTKDELGGDISDYSSYVIPTATLRKLWIMMELKLMERYLSAKVDTPTRRVSTASIKKYTKARWAGGAKSHQCTLIPCEGDSARSLIHLILTHRSIPMTYDTYGTFDTGGVLMNSRTKISVLKNGVVKRQQKLVDNERLSSFETVMNLKHGVKYETETERKTLNYGSIVACVDQDLDGIGQIFGLLVSHIALFWPALIKAGFVKIMATPIIRAYPKTCSSGKNGRKVESFYTDAQYSYWLRDKKIDTSKWDIKYYKGLATHNDQEALHMFKTFDDTITTIRWDDLAANTLNVYYGTDPSLRKIELVKDLDVDEKTDEVCRRVEERKKDMACSRHIKIHTKEFQIDNILRKLPHIMDGLNPARRKVLCGALKKFASSNSEMKVFQLAGYVAEAMNYHHGSASLEQTITKMAQDFVGANNIPWLLPLSQFGSRYAGGNDAGAPRYIKTELNRAMVLATFPADDVFLLEHVVDEGQTCEPVYYVPVVPTCILESVELPASGWKYEGYARDFSAVVLNIRKLLARKDFVAIGDCAGSGDAKGRDKVKLVNADLDTMPFWQGKWTGEVRDAHGDKWFMGRYTINDARDTIHITELPYQTWNNSFIESMEKHDVVQSIEDNSSKLQIDITVKLKPGAFETIVDVTTNKNGKALGKGKHKAVAYLFDSIESYFNLRSFAGKHLNVMENGGVRECRSYKEIFIRWFYKRKELYERRVERLTILAKLRIEFYEEITRFVGEHDKYNFSKMDMKTAVAKLSKGNYPLFNKSLLDNPGFIPNDKLEKQIRTKGSSYSYLLAIGPVQRMDKARTVRASKLKELKRELAKLEDANAVRKLWSGEVDVVAGLVEKAQADPRGWLCGKRKAVFR